MKPSWLEYHITGGGGFVGNAGSWKFRLIYINRSIYNLGSVEIEFCRHEYGSVAVIIMYIKSVVDVNLFLNAMR